MEEKVDFASAERFAKEQKEIEERSLRMRELLRLTNTHRQVREVV